MGNSFEKIAVRFARTHLQADKSWVSQGAKDHGCGVQFKTCFEKPTPHDYNIHTTAGYDANVRQDTLNRLASVESVVLTCIDRRSVTHVAGELLPDAFFATAGGPAQEYSRSRWNTDLDFFVALVEKSPSLANVFFVSHSDTCGGLKVMTDGQSTQYHGDQEVDLMQTLTNNFANEFLSRASRNVSVATGVAIVEHDQFQYIKWS